MTSISSIGIRQFSLHLQEQGFTIKKLSQPYADIVAEKDNIIYFYEIKATRRTEGKYFGAATLAEWKCALQNKGKYFFVIAICDDERMISHKVVSPEELITYSSIPPFKVNFNYPLMNNNCPSKEKVCKDDLHKMIDFYEKENGLNLSIAEYPTL